MLRQHAALSIPPSLDDPAHTVRDVSGLIRDGWTVGGIQGQIRARRWQRVGRAVVRHNGPLHPDERAAVVLVNSGPRSVLTGFTAAHVHGLEGWERPWIDVLVPAGTRIQRVPGIATRVHYTGNWPGVMALGNRRLQLLAPAVVRAAGTLASPRAACGLLAGTVQQHLLRPDALMAELAAAPRVRHRAVLMAAAHDIGQGTHALSEIDFARLGRRHGLPEPVRQAVRVEPSGRRRYLDAEWTRRDGRRVVAEVDGALHLIARRWWDDQIRQNELVIAGDLVLRFPSVLVRCEELIVVGQLRRALSG
jgi:hypothetical protein